MNTGSISNDINSDTDLFELGVGVDSVSTLELVIALEEEFGINIDESEISYEIFSSLGSLTDFVNEYLD